MTAGEDFDDPVDEYRQAARTHLDPRWEWIEDRRLCDPAPTYVKVACNHLDTVPVETTAGGIVETVAHLCLTCDAQLPAEVGQRACTCGGWHYDGETCPKSGTQIMATGSEGWDL